MGEYRISFNIIIYNIDFDSTTLLVNIKKCLA